MTTGITEPYSTPPPEAPPKNSFQRIAGVLFAPAETFRDIARRPDFLVPLLVILAVMYLSVVLTGNRIDWDAAIDQQVETIKKQRPEMAEADIRRQAEMGRAIGKVSIWFAPLLFVAGYAIVAGVLLLAVRLFGGEGTYKQAFSATLYAWMPVVLAAIIGTIVILARGGLIDPTTMQTLVKSNPGFLVDMKEQPILFAALSSLDLFGLWRLALLVFGFAALSKISRMKTAVIVISLWLALTLVKLGFAAFQAGMQS